MRLPARDEWRAYLHFLAAFCALFFPVYFGADYLTEGSGRALAMYHPAEVAIPFVPAMIVPYVSLYTVFVLPLLHMTAADMSALSRQSTLSLLIAGACFLIVPGQMGFPPRIVDGWTAPIYGAIAAIDARHNFVPSLHVTFAALILLPVMARVPRALALAYAVWLALLTASTILVHQHHLIDIPTGFLLALFARTIFPYPTPLMPAAPSRA